MGTCKHLCFVLGFLLLIPQLRAQEFSADRPGATTGPTVLPAGRLQLETGFAWERSGLNNSWETTWTVNTSMLRLGLTPYAELRLQANYLISLNNKERKLGFDSVLFGTKAKLFDGWKFLPAVSLMANVFVPGKKGSAFLNEQWGGQMALLCENTVTSWFSIGYEAELLWKGDVKPDVFWGLCLGFQPWERVGFQLEQFNRKDTDGIHCWAELSCAVQVSPRVQLDIASDLSLNSPARYAILMFGVSWQITRR